VQHVLFEHSSPVEHVPQFRVPPHPSEIVPQVAPWAAQVVCWQQWFETQVCPLEHDPQKVFRQPSKMSPQFAPCAAHVVLGEQQVLLTTSLPGGQQTFEMQTSPPVVQFPHVTTFPQVSPNVPQKLVPHRLGVLSSPHEPTLSHSHGEVCVAQQSELSQEHDPTARAGFGTKSRAVKKAVATMTNRCFMVNPLVFSEYAGAGSPISSLRLANSV